MQIVNSKDIEKLIKIDKLFAHIQDIYGIPPNWQNQPGFISLSKIILGQQVSLASAQAHFNKLNDYLPEFNPLCIMVLSDEEFRNAQISKQKAKYLRELSSAILDKSLDLEKLSNFDPNVIRSKLMTIKGIGNWTADIYLMFCMQSKDIFPIGDIAIVNTVLELTDAKTKDEISALSEKWKPLRSLACYFLWHYYLTKRNRVAVY